MKDISKADKDLACGANVRVLGHDDMDRLLNLQQRVASTLPEEQFEVDDARFYVRLFRGEGRILGLFDEKRLIACSVIYWPGAESADNLGAELDLNLSQLADVANLEAAYMLPGCQGLGIARKLSGMQLEHAVKIGKRFALSTVSPENLYSIKNLFSLGFSIRKITRKYGTKTRFIMYRGLIGEKQTGSEGTWVLGGDLALQSRLLSAGYEGVGAKGDIENWSILYSVIEIPVSGDGF